MHQVGFDLLLEFNVEDLELSLSCHRRARESQLTFVS
jgi:hypothetical protein